MEAYLLGIALNCTPFSSLLLSSITPSRKAEFLFQIQYFTRVSTWDILL
jgi:hypothetical protein